MCDECVMSATGARCEQAGTSAQPEPAPRRPDRREKATAHAPATLPAADRASTAATATAIPAADVTAAAGNVSATAAAAPLCHCQHCQQRCSRQSPLPRRRRDAAATPPRAEPRARGAARLLHKCPPPSSRWTDGLCGGSGRACPAPLQLRLAPCPVRPLLLQRRHAVPLPVCCCCGGGCGGGGAAGGGLQSSTSLPSSRHCRWRRRRSRCGGGPGRSSNSCCCTVAHLAAQAGMPARQPTPSHTPPCQPRHCRRWCARCSPAPQVPPAASAAPPAAAWQRRRHSRSTQPRWQSGASVTPSHNPWPKPPPRAASQ